MASKTKFFSWSKGRQSTGEYHRTGGLLPIDTSVGDTGKVPLLVEDAKNAVGPGRRRPPNLNLTIPPDQNNKHHYVLSPASARHNAALVNSASNLLAVVNDMLRSPALSATICTRSAEIHKPLPSRPRSVSLPSTPNPPVEAVELPGSILLENQGFPSPPVAGPAADTMRSVRSGNSLGSSVAAKSTPSKVPQHKKSSTEISLQRRSKSRPSLVASPSSTDSKLTTCSVSTNGARTSSSESTKAQVGADKPLQPSPVILEGQQWRTSGEPSSARRDELISPTTPTPTSTRSKHLEELKFTITAQDSTISTLQAQFGSLRATHEAHVASLIDAHTAELASLKNYTRVLEEQQSQRTLHHDGPQSPSREQSPQNTVDSATSTRSFRSALEQQGRSSPHSRDSPEMENLKRKLSVARRPDVGNRDTIRELNQYKQNNAALQKQIESLMSKLNQSKKNERNLTSTLEEAEKKCSEWKDKARKIEQLEKSTLALQNTVDHLEHRLEMANCEKLDAEEQLFNLQSQRSPFDPKTPKLQMPPTHPNSRQSAHTSMSTVFSSGSPTSHHNESENPTTLSAFISHIERLQEHNKQKDVHITELENTTKKIRLDYDSLTNDHRKLNLQSDIQGQLLQKAKNTDVHIEQLRSAIIDREGIIGEKEKSLRIAERQLEHHKLLLQAEIRRHATLSLYTDDRNNPLPDLTSLTSKDDIDRWIERLQKRLKKEKPKSVEKKSHNPLDAVVDDLRKEVDFYVREIIYYKLDIKGYKSDIKKLKHIATRMGSYGSRTFELDSPSPSLARSGDTPVRARFSSGTSGLGISATPSPISTGPISATLSTGRPLTPPAQLLTPDPSPAELSKPALGTHKRFPHELRLATPMSPHTPPRKEGVNPANDADNIDPGISPRSVARLSPERRKPTPPSPDQEKFGEMATNFPLSTPAAPKRHDTQRSMSDSIIQLYTAPRTPDWAPVVTTDAIKEEDHKSSAASRGRSVSVNDANNGKTTPERPPRPRYGLFESPRDPGRAGDTERLPTPPRLDVLAEAMRNSPDRLKHDPQPAPECKLTNPSVLPLVEAPPPLQPAELRGLSNSNLSRTGSAGFGSAIPPPLPLRQRAGSSGSSTTALPRPAPPQRKDSTGSGANIPFVIGMGSPHNPALITPTTSVSPTACSITGKSASKVQSPTSRAGVGGTMASSTPLTSPVSPTDTSRPNQFSSALPVAKGSSSKPATTTHGRNSSLTGPLPRSWTISETMPRSAPHSRTPSASSIMSALQLPNALMKGKGKARKDSISHPTPLASPFDIDRTTQERAHEIGKAI
ncbi:hypothetical protein BDV96DRAFT_593831 [Lophiotrema nucula]|uniref:Uncharacterized protein n=1 Tax=Lophiotrema nucula TaxID=690887 RepID=A0A6A5ZQA8_9PLEO|nr:hypothetical protein BDV96DRAFT_593831 [Lophiotrema nucula]